MYRVMPPEKRLHTEPQIPLRGGRDEVGEAKITNLSDTKPPASLNIAAYPYILSLILDHSTPSTRTTLLRCSKSTFEDVVGRVYRNLRLTSEELVNLIQLGWAPSTCESTTGRLGLSFSPYLREALNHVRTLHLLRYHPSNVLAIIPRGCFAAIENLVLHLSEAWPHHRVNLQRTLFHLGASHVYLRINPGTVLADDAISYPEISLSNLPKSTQTVTIITPLAYRSLVAPQFKVNFTSMSAVTNLFVAPVGKATVPRVTMLIQPWEPQEQDKRIQMISEWLFYPSTLAKYSDIHPASFIGAEYLGFQGDSKRLVTSDRASFVNLAQYLTFSTFAAWLDSSEADVVFTREEAAGLWRQDIIQMTALHRNRETQRCHDIKQNTARLQVAQDLIAEGVPIRDRIASSSQYPMTALRHEKDRLAQEAELLAIELRRLTLRLEQGHRDGKVMPGWSVGL